MSDDRKALILGTVQDAAGKLFYYDRKEDEDLPVGAIEAAIADGTITVDEIVAEFRKNIVIE